MSKPMSSPESCSAIVLDLAEEFLDRYRRGERPSLKQYIDRYPALAGEIGEVFPAMAMMENIALNDESLASDPTGPLCGHGGTNCGHPGAARRFSHPPRDRAWRQWGWFYEAEQISLGRHVALKVLSPSTGPPGRAEATV